MSFGAPGFLYGQDPSGHEKQQHAQFLMGAGEEDAYDDDRFLKSPGEQDLADEGQGGRSSSTDSRYTRDSFGNPKLRGNEMMQWMDRNPDPQPEHRVPG